MRVVHAAPAGWRSGESSGNSWGSTHWAFQGSPTVVPRPHHVPVALRSVIFDAVPSTGPSCSPKADVLRADGTTWGGPVAESQKTLVLCRPRRRSPCPRSAIRACFSTGGTSRGLGGVPKVQRSRDWMGALDACAHRAASDAQMAARMANGARDNVCAMFIPLLHDDSMRAQCARNILLPRRPRARRLAD